MPAPTTVTSRSACLNVPIMMTSMRIVLLRLQTSDPGLLQNPAQHGGELWVAVEGACAVVVRDALPARLFSVEMVKLEEGLAGVADKADGRDDDTPDALPRQPLQLVFEVRLKPRHLAVARLVAERPRMF